MYTSVKVVHRFRPNDTSTVEDLNEELFQLHIPALVLVSLCLIVGVFGNLLVLYIYKSKFKRSNHRYFILFLASIDLCACVIGLPFLIASLRLPYLMDLEGLCKTVRYFHYLVNNASGLLLVVISAERFQRICRPFKRQLSVRQTLRACYVVTFISAIIAIPAPIFFGKSTVQTGVGNLTGTECYIADEFKTNHLMEMYQGGLFIETVVCIIIFAILYTLIIRRVWTHDQFVDAMKSMKITGSSTYDSPSCSTDMAENDLRVDANGSDVTRKSTENIILKSLKATTMAGDASSEAVTLNLGEDGTNGKATSLKASNGQGSTEGSLERHGKKKDGKLAVHKSFSDTNISKVTRPRYVRKAATVKSKKTSLRRIFSKISSKSKSIDQDKRKSRATVRVTIMLFTISIVFVLAFIPHLVLMVLTAHSKSFLVNLTKDQIIVYQLFLRIFIINNIANPIIYGFCDKKFRKCCWDILRGSSEPQQIFPKRYAS